MSNIVLLAVNAKYVHSSLSVWVLAESISRYARLPHNVEIVETTIHSDDSETADQIAAYAPDVLGISTYIWNAAKLTGLLELLKKRLPGMTIVLGGPEASHNSGFWLERGADHVLRGEGEHSFPAFLDALAVGGDGPGPVNKSAAELSGLSKTGKFEAFTQRHAKQGSLSAKRDHGEPVDPYSGAYLAALRGRIAYLETSRGCPYRCAFCLSGAGGAGDSVRFFPPDTVKRQILKLSRSGTQTIKLVDRTFNCNAGRAYDLFEHIIGLDTACRFHFEVAADLFDGRTLELLAAAPPGRIQLEAGLQSFFEPALEAVSRRTDTAEAERNIRMLLRGRNIHVHVDLIAGLPNETLSDFQDSFDRAFALNAHNLQLGFLKLLHGSALREQAEHFGISYSAEPPYEIQSSPWLSGADIRTLKNAENALSHTCNKGRFLSSIGYALHVSGLRPFSLFRGLGEAAPNHGTQLAEYAGHVYGFCSKLPGVDADELRDRMTCDWLAMTKGSNMPAFLKNPDRKRAKAAAIAEKALGRKVGRNEYAVLRSGMGIYVDSVTRDPVTGLYALHSVPLFSET